MSIESQQPLSEQATVFVDGAAELETTDGIVFPEKPVHAYSPDITAFEDSGQNLVHLQGIRGIFDSDDKLRTKLEQEQLPLWKINLVVGAVFGSGVVYEHTRDTKRQVPATDEF